MTNEKYNGYTNYETWNIALWISNEEPFYRAAIEPQTYIQFLEASKHLRADQTPDGVSWADPKLNIEELDEVIKETE